MSFYGNVFYEFKNLFQKFKFINTGLDNSAVDINTLNSTVNGTTATENWDTLHIESGNRWIGLQSMPESGTHKGVNIFHRAPGGDVTATPTFALTNNTGTQLAADQAFETISLDIDSAGHVAKVNKITYQLPDSEAIVNNGLTSYYDDGGVSVNCAKVDGDDVVELVPGQEIDFATLQLNKKGLVSGFSHKTYKLPMSDAEKDYSELQERVGIAEETLENLVTTIPETYATIESTGSVDNFYIDPEGVENKFDSIAQGIGNLEQSSTLITGAESNTVSVSEQLTKLYEIIMQKTAEVSTFATAIEGLQARVKLLEKQVEELSATE